jgi:hypothetical protein
VCSFQTSNCAPLHRSKVYLLSELKHSQLLWYTCVILPETKETFNKFSCYRPTVCVLQNVYEGVSKSFRTGSLERELQMVQLSVTRCSCIDILWVNLVSFAAIPLCVASQRMFIVVIYFVTDSVRKLLDTPSYVFMYKRKMLLIHHCSHIIILMINKF